MSNISLVNNNQSTEERDRVQDELIQARINFFDMLHAEPQSLYKFLHPHEKIIGAMRGHLPQGGAAMLVATDKRIMYLDKTAFNVKVEEISYQVVSGITYEVGRYFSHVTLHTANGPIQLRWVTTSAAEIFIHMLELICIENNLQSVASGIPPPQTYQPGLRTMSIEK
ncbi:MAG TPA: PH domain-containing protein [Candidatus Microsaccharimonas sp.]|jgi:hypothetical protein